MPAPILGVLAVEGLYLLAGKVAQAQRLGLDVEGAPPGYYRLFLIGVDPVVPDVPDAAENNSGSIKLRIWGRLNRESGGRQ
jgi:hypothetical protein